MKTRSQFENRLTHQATTIAPNPHFRYHKTLVEAGWQFVTRDIETGEIVSTRNPDEVREEIWRNFGHKTLSDSKEATCDTVHSRRSGS